MIEKAPIAVLAMFLSVSSPVKATNDAHVLYGNLERSLNLKTEAKSIQVNREQIKSVEFMNQQQRKMITGTVVDDAGLPIIGASIIAKDDPTVRAITNVNGEFTMSQIAHGTTLVVSYIGFLDQTVVVTADKGTYRIMLHQDTQKLEEVVVVGYGVQKKVNMTGAISNVKADELSEIPNTNLSNSLAGRAPGATISGNSGLMGATSEIRMRGGFGEPLFVIDGIIRNKEAFDHLEAYEIDQISFLKDAATASIYGSAAGNGVVLVKTKGGVKNQKPVFNYQGSYAFSKPTQQLFADRWTAIDELNYQNAVARFQGLKEPNGEAEYAYFRDNHINYNVNDYIWQDPWNTKHSLSARGGSEKVQYYVMGSFYNPQNETFRKNKTKRCVS